MGLCPLWMETAHNHPNELIQVLPYTKDQELGIWYLRSSCCLLCILRVCNCMVVILGVLPLLVGTASDLYCITTLQKIVPKGPWMSFPSPQIDATRVNLGSYICSKPCPVWLLKVVPSSHVITEIWLDSFPIKEGTKCDNCMTLPHSSKESGNTCVLAHHKTGCNLCNTDTPGS